MEEQGIFIEPDRIALSDLLRTAAYLGVDFITNPETTNLPSDIAQYVARTAKREQATYHPETTFLFFNNPNFRRWSEVSKITQDYASECEHILTYREAMYRGVNSGFILPDVLTYRLNTTFPNAEERQLLCEPTQHYHNHLESILGQIRSINGIIPEKKKSLLVAHNY